jgi:hypothetical protein
MNLFILMANLEIYVSMKIGAFWEFSPCSLVLVNCRLRVRTAPVALMMEAMCISETSVYFSETTRHYIPKGSSLKYIYRVSKKEHYTFKMIQKSNTATFITLH